MDMFVLDDDVWEKTLPLDEQVEKIMKSFDFKKVHKTMILLDWKWATKKGPQVPSTKAIKAQARKMLAELVDTYDEQVATRRFSTGGFSASRCYDSLFLQFVLESAEAE